jgi:hypothetical protein
MDRAQSRAEIAADFEAAEGSLLLEGITPTPFYFRVKQRILDRNITLEEGRREIIAYHAEESRRDDAKAGECTHE